LQIDPIIITESSAGFKREKALFPEETKNFEFRAGKQRRQIAAAVA